MTAVTSAHFRHKDPAFLDRLFKCIQASFRSRGSEGLWLSIRDRFILDEIKKVREKSWKSKSDEAVQLHSFSAAMKELLRGFHHKSGPATEPLIATFDDMQENAGKDCRLPSRSIRPDDSLPTKSPDQSDSDDPRLGSKVLIQLARQGRLNTSVRQSIFVAVTAATDCCDAISKLSALQLKRSQQMEVAKVLVHCATTEVRYNHYYSLLARQLCATRHLRKAFEFTLWDRVRCLDSVGPATSISYTSDVRSLLNLARLYSSLVGTDCLGILVLRVGIPFRKWRDGGIS